MNVPLSVGPEYKELNNAGVSCLVYDIIVNMKVIQEACDDETGQYRDFLCHLCIQSVEQKYPKNGALDRQYKLPKLKYMGFPIKSQCIRDKKSIPKIQDVSEAPAIIPKVSAKKNKVNDKINHKNFSVNDEDIGPDRDLPFRLVWLKEKTSSHDDVSRRADNHIQKSINNVNNYYDYDDNDANIINNNLNPCRNSRSKGFYNSSHYESNIKFSTSTSNGREYSEPIVIPPNDVIGIALFFHFPGSTDWKKIDVQTSPFKFQVFSTNCFKSNFK